MFRWRHTRRQCFENRLTLRRSFRDGRIHARLRLQVDLDYRYTVERVGFDVFNVIDRCGQGPLGDGRDAAFHFLGRHARVGPNDADDRDVDCRKNVLRHLEQAKGASDHQQDRNDGEGVGGSEGDLYNPHNLSVSYRLRLGLAHWRRLADRDIAALVGEMSGKQPANEQLKRVIKQDGHQD